MLAGGVSDYVNIARTMVFLRYGRVDCTLKLMITRLATSCNEFYGQIRDKVKENMEVDRAFYW